MALPENQTTTLCPFPRAWYQLTDPEGPCAQTDKVVTGAPQQPWINGKDMQGSPTQGWSSSAGASAGTGGLFDDVKALLGSISSGAKTVFVVGVGLATLWLLVRGYEAYKK